MAVQISGNDITVPRDGSFTRNVTIGGTLTYEDVTNVDSVGLVTARDGVVVVGRGVSITAGGLNVTAGISTFGSDVKVAGIISASTNTDGTTDLLTLHADADGTNNGVASIKFTGNAGNHSSFIKGGHTTNGDTILTFHTDDYASGFNPEERLRISSNGDVRVGGGAPATFGSGTTVHETYNASTYTANLVTSGTHQLQMTASQTHGATSIGTRSNHNLNLCANDSTKATITTDGKVGISTVSPDARLHVLAGNEKGILIEDNSTTNNAPYLEIIGKRDDGNVHQSFSAQVFLSRNRTEQKISSGLKLGTILFGGNHTNASKSNIAYPASIAGVSAGDFNSVSDMPTDLVFYTGSTGRTPSTSNVSSGEEAMRILSSGAVRKPLQPRFWAKSGSAQTLLSDGTTMIRDFNNEQFDTGGCYDGTNKFTAPITGYYAFGWGFMVSGSNADTFTYLFGRPAVDGNGLAQEVMMPRSGGATYVSVVGSHLLYLTSGQYVQIQMRQSGGSNVAVRADQGYFWGYLAN